MTSCTLAANFGSFIFRDFAAQAALGYRHDDPCLVNIKPDRRETIPMIRLLCMRLGTGPSGATLATCIP